MDSSYLNAWSCREKEIKSSRLTTLSQRLFIPLWNPLLLVYTLMIWRLQSWSLVLNYPLIGSRRLFPVSTAVFDFGRGFPPQGLSIQMLISPLMLVPWGPAGARCIHLCARYGTAWGSALSYRSPSYQFWPSILSKNTALVSSNIQNIRCRFSNPGELSISFSISKHRNSQSIFLRSDLDNSSISKVISCGNRRRKYPRGTRHPNALKAFQMSAGPRWSRIRYRSSKDMHTPDPGARRCSTQ